MATSTRRARAERNRRRLPPRSAAARWSRRLIGLLATLAFIGVAVAIATMVMPDDGGGKASASVPTPASLSAKSTEKHKTVKHHEKKAKHKPKGPSKAALASLDRAVGELRKQGYTTLETTDYDVKDTLRVLVGRPVGDASGGSYAFFFKDGTYLGRDASSPSARVVVVKSSETSVTLSYGLFSGDGSAPDSFQRVTFRLSGDTVAPQGTIPDAGERLTKSSD